MAAGSDIFNRIQKIFLLGLIIAAFPLVAFYMIMPRLAIVPGVGNAQFEFIDISVANFTGEPGMPLDPNKEETATLDFWIEVGLPLKKAASDAFDRGTGPDLRYYFPDGTVNKNNLEDETMQLVVPILKIAAKYKDTILGTGGSFRQYVLNADHPVEYVHLYLTGSRMPNGGLMYMFNSMASNGVLDQVLLEALGVGGSGGDDPFKAILGDLKLELTAYLGSTPLTLPLDMSAFMSPFPCIDASSRGTINPGEFEMPGDPRVYYDHSVNQDTMTRFETQLGLEDLDGLLAALGITGPTGVAQLLVMLDQLLSPDPIWFNTTTAVPYWTSGTNVTTSLVYSVPELNVLLLNEIADFKTAHDPGDSIDYYACMANVDDKAALDSVLRAFSGSQALLNSSIMTNTTSWYTRRHVYPHTTSLVVPGPSLDFVGIPADVVRNITLYNTARGEDINITIVATTANLFTILANDGYGIGDFFHGLSTDVPTVLTALLFKSGLEMYGMEEQVSSDTDWIAIAPVMAGIDADNLLFVVVIVSFGIVFLIFALTKGSVKLNRSDFLGRDNVARNVKEFISRVEQLGGKVSVQNAESLVIRTFRTEGKIDKITDVEKRAKVYVENQKLLVTLQSRASRAYVAQKFKDCIGAIEKMIQIARKLEDQTLVQNYEENLAKVVRLLRRKGISVSTKVRVDEGAKPGDEVEQLSIYKKELIDLQNRASKAFAEKNFGEAKESIKQMLAIAKKIQDPVLIRNYEANLRKIIAMEKGGSV